MLQIAINIGIPVFLILLAMVTGSILERRHFNSIHAREQIFRNLPTFSGPDYPADRPIEFAGMRKGSVVISVDYFKRLLAGLRRLFGGELHSYASLLDRARREAVLRMKERCPDADMFVNVRIETSRISRGQGGAIGCTEVVAYGTAIRFADSTQSSGGQTP